MKTVLHILEQSELGGIYHITNENPPDLATLIDYSERYLNIQGVRAMWDVAIDDPNPAEELLDRFLKPYRPYLSDKRIFDRSTINRMVPTLSPPAFTYDLFERCMAYAEACAWGKMDGFPR